MVKQSFLLDPDAVAYTDDQIVGKVNAAAVNITRANAVASDAVDLSGKDADDLSESTTKKWAGASGADFIKAADDLDDITEGTTKKHFTDTEKTKLTGIEEGADVNIGEEFTTAEQTKLGTVEDNAAADQTGDEMVTALEGLGAGNRLGSDKIDQIADAKFLTDAEETKVATIDQVYSDAEKTKLTSVEEDATADQSGTEVRDLIVALGDTERKLVITEPVAGEYPIISVQRDADGKTKVSYDDEAIE